MLWCLFFFWTILMSIPGPSRAFCVRKRKKKVLAWSGRHASPCISEWCWSWSRWLLSVPLLVLCLLTAGRNVQPLSQNITLCQTVLRCALLFRQVLTSICLLLLRFHAPFGGVYRFCLEEPCSEPLFFWTQEMSLIIKYPALTSLCGT